MTSTHDRPERARVRALDEGGGTLWHPERLLAAAGGVEQVAAFRYVVVEEAVDDLLVLQVWAWPHVDASGRLFWDPAAPPLEVAVHRPLLHAQVYAHQLKRAPRVGDAFAGTLGVEAEALAVAVVEDLRDVFPDGLFDVSAEAHQVAKLAYQGSLAAIAAPRPGQPEERVRLSGTVKHLQLTAPAVSTPSP